MSDIDDELDAIDEALTALVEMVMAAETWDEFRGMVQNRARENFKESFEQFRRSTDGG